MATDISLSGSKGCGKSTVANALIQANDNYVKLSFAQPLKRFLQLILEQDQQNSPQTVIEALYGDKDNTYVSFNPSAWDVQFQLAEMGKPGLNVSAVAALFENWVNEFNDGELVKEPVTGRVLLQYIGTEFFRNKIQSTFWVDLMRAKIATEKLHGNNVIVDDTRFQDEVALLESLGFITIKIEGTDTDSTHDSETGLKDYQFDCYLLNDKTKGLEPIHKFVQGII